MGGARKPDSEPVATVALRVVPRGARNAVEGYRDGALRVRLTAPPVEDRANEALLVFLARALDVPRARIALAAGSRSRNKIVRVSGMSRGEFFRRLGLQEPADQSAVHLDRRAR